MKLTRILTAIAMVSFGCAQGRQQAPAASATASPEKAPRVETRKPVPSVTAPEAGPVETAAKAAPTPRPRVRLDIPAGTLLPIEIQTAVSTAHSQEGDPVLAVLTEDVPLKGFKLDKGAEVRGKVLTAVSAKRVKGRAHLVVGFDGVMKSGERISIATENIDSLAASTKSKDTKIIAGAAAGGLIVGAIKDGGKGAAIGTLIGAAAGTGAVLVMKGDEVEIPRGARLSISVTK
jgi:hypothetical protein